MSAGPYTDGLGVNFSLVSWFGLAVVGVTTAALAGFSANEKAGFATEQKLAAKTAITELGTRINNLYDDLTCLIGKANEQSNGNLGAAIAAVENTADETDKTIREIILGFSFIGDDLGYCVKEHLNRDEPGNTGGTTTDNDRGGNSEEVRIVGPDENYLNDPFTNNVTDS